MKIQRETDVHKWIVLPRLKINLGDSYVFMHRISQLFFSFKHPNFHLEISDIRYSITEQWRLVHFGNVGNNGSQCIESLIKLLSSLSFHLTWFNGSSRQLAGFLPLFLGFGSLAFDTSSLVCSKPPHLDDDP